MAVYKLELEKLAQDKRKRFFHNHNLLPGDYYIIGGEQPASPEEDREKLSDLTMIALVEDGQFLHYDRPKTEENKEFYFRRKIEFDDVLKFFSGMDLTPVNKGSSKAKKNAKSEAEEPASDDKKTAKAEKKAATTEKKAKTAEKKAKTVTKTVNEPKSAAEKTTATKLSDKKIAEIKKCRAKGMTIKATAEKVGVSESTVRKYGKE